MGLPSPSLDEFHFCSCSRMFYCKLQHACSFLLLTTFRSDSPFDLSLPSIQPPLRFNHPFEQPRLPKLSLPPLSGQHPAFSKPCSQSPAARPLASRKSFPQRRSISKSCWALPANIHTAIAIGFVDYLAVIVARFVFLSPRLDGYVFLLIGDGGRELIP